MHVITQYETRLVALTSSNEQFAQERLALQVELTQARGRIQELEVNNAQLRSQIMGLSQTLTPASVSYTHLTLPTIYSV